MDNDFYEQNPYFQAIDSFIDNLGVKNTFRYSKRNHPNVYVITIEMPGYSKENIAVNTINSGLKITAISRGRKKHQLIHVPFPIKKKRTKAKYNNGLLTISIRKGKGRSIEIE